jgi:exodeoxyribonuclease V gamma subunit
MLHVHRAERADGLVDALRALLAEPLPDPFAPEVIAVPTRGMERWLTQRMSVVLGASPGRADGICANVDFPSPRRLVEDAVAVASGIEPDADAWRPERLVWPLLEVVDGALHEPWLKSLASHLGATVDTANAARQSRRFASVRHIAELYDRYALQRPGMVRAWARGDDVDATGARLPDDALWQAELWRRLRDRVGQPDPAERIEGACARLRERPDLVELPARLSLFGLTRLPAGRLQVLDALAAGREVHLFVLHPSPALWERVAAEPPPPTPLRAEDPTRDLPANRLLASWGQDVRELQLMLRTAGGADHHHPTAGTATAAFGGDPQDRVGEVGGGETLLARIQRGIRADRPPPGAPLPGAADERPRLEPGDRSVQVHACHGRGRQVEVLRDAILHELAADSTLEPRDVIVMCPDVETFAPLIQATFGAGEIAPDEDELEELPEELRPPDLRVRLADRSLRQTNPVLGFTQRLLELADQRLTASQVLDLADREPVRRRFRLDDDALARLEEWVAESGIRWGLDAEHRTPFKLAKLPTGTWRSGLDRVLLGVAMTEEEQRLFGGVLPLDDVESGAIELAGRLAELVDRLHAVVDTMAVPMSVEAWVAAIAHAADSLTDTASREAWQRDELQRVLDDVVTEARVAGAATTTLSLPEVRALLAGRLEGRPTTTNFRTGHLTICTLVPMRSVPHRVVCLLGLDDGEFPRKAVRDGDDLVLRRPHVGDRDSRTEDRQMLLDALMAATDRLIVTYRGKDERTNTPRPPAVPVGELLDVVDATARGEEDAPARSQVLVQHPLQPFDPRNFTTGALVPETTWGFDRITLAGARAMTAPRTAPAPFLEHPLPDAAPALVALDDLVRFVEHPVRAFLRQRLDIRLGDFEDEVADSLSVELDRLEQSGVGRRLLDARLAGAPMEACVEAEQARGLLPPGNLGAPVIEALVPEVEAIAQHALALTAEPATSADVRVALPDGRTLSGTVAGIHGGLLRDTRFARVRARHRIALWIRWLALTAAHPERAFEAVLVGRASSGVEATMTIARHAWAAADATGPADADRRRALALERLAPIVELHRLGLREPLPLPCETAAAYALDGEAAARKAWASTWSFPREDKDLEHQLAFGRVLTFAELLAAPPCAGEEGEGWDLAETSRFGRLGRRMWGGLLATEELAHR